MVIIKERLGANTLMNHIIHNDTPDNPRSYSSYLQLVRYYKDHDDDYNDNWHYYFITRRHFLRRRKRENGGKHWNCHYCGKVVKKMQKRNTHKQEKGCITVDHIEAIGVGGDKLDTKNMVESCQKCNGKKGTTSYVEYTRNIMKEYIIKDRYHQLEVKIKFCAKNDKDASEILGCSLYRIKRHGESNNIDNPYDDVFVKANNLKSVGVLGDDYLLHEDAMNLAKTHWKKETEMWVSNYNELEHFVNDLAKRLFNNKLIYYVEYTVHKTYMTNEKIHCTEYFINKTRDGYEIIFYFDNMYEKRLSFTNWSHTGIALNDLKPYKDNGDKYVFWSGEFAIPVYTFKSDDEYINHLY